MGGLRRASLRIDRALFYRSEKYLKEVVEDD